MIASWTPPTAGCNDRPRTWGALLVTVLELESECNFPSGQTYHVGRYPSMGTEKGEWLIRLQEIVASILRKYRVFPDGEYGADDLAQELTIKLLDLPLRYPECNIEGLGRLAWTSCLNHLRDFWIHKDREARNSKRCAVDVLHAEDDSILATEEAGLLMNTLDAAGQETLKLLLEGHHQAEVARMLGLSRSGVSERVAQIREKALALGISPD